MNPILDLQIHSLNGLQMNNEKRFSSPIKRLTIIAAALALGTGFLPGSANAAVAPLNLGVASTYGVLASAAFTSATPSAVIGTAGGDIGYTSAFTGTVAHTGSLYTGSATTIALTNAATALADNRSGTATPVELGVGRVITPGAYFGGTLEVNGTLTLDGQGDPASVFIFRAASTLVTGVSSTVKLINGARACNVYWQLGSAATLGTNSKMSGHVIAQSSISTGAGTSVAGQLIAISGSVTLGGTTIANNGCLPTPNILTPSTAPVQTSDVIAYAPVAGLIAGGEIVSVEVADAACPVINVSVGGVMLATTQWSQNATTVSIIMPAHVVGTVEIQLYNGCAPLVSPMSYIYQTTSAYAPSAEMATLHIIKVVTNSATGTLTPSSFIFHVMHNGTDVDGSPKVGSASPGITYVLPAGSYVLSEDPTPGYGGTWSSGSITAGGTVVLVGGTDVTVTRSNYEIASTPVTPTPTPTASPAPTATPEPTATPAVPPTETTATGGTLPNTSTPWGNALLIGAGLVILGAVGFSFRKGSVK